MGKNEIKKRKKRSDLLKSAYELFTTVGFSKTTIDNIAAKADVGKGTFYLYFKDKAEIREQLIVNQSAILLNKAVQELKKYEKKHNEAGEPALTITDKIIFITDYVINYLSKDIALLKFISKNLSWGMLVNSTSSAKDNEEMGSFQQFIMEEFAKEDIAIREPMLLIFTILEMINSTCYNIILKGEPVTFSEYKPYLYDTIRVLIDHSIIPPGSPEAEKYRGEVANYIAAHQEK